MLQIMQDYMEIVCILGSSENCDNAGIFMQADARYLKSKYLLLESFFFTRYPVTILFLCPRKFCSVSVEPLYPQVCQKKAVYYKSGNCLGPIDISRELNSMACSLSVKREDPISFYHLIMEARHFVATLWSSGTKVVDFQCIFNLNQVHLRFFFFFRIHFSIISSFQVINSGFFNKTLITNCFIVVFFFIIQFISYIFYIYLSRSSVLVVLLCVSQPGAGASDDVHVTRTFDDRPGVVVLVCCRAVDKHRPAGQTGGPRRDEEAAGKDPGGRKLGRK